MQRIGDYNLIEEIGAGGMGRVYLAENVHHKKRYALKVLPVELAQDAGFRQRFLAEARVMSELDHPRIVRVHHMGEDQGTYFLVMDYIAGPTGRPQSLLDVLKASPSGRIEPDLLRAWAGQIAEGLAQAHAEGVVHRDIKPANVLLDKTGQVRITDFGLAKAAGAEFLRSMMQAAGPAQDTVSDMPTIGPARPVAQRTLSDQPTWRSGDQARPGQTSAGSLLGTYDYMSPEQRGDLPGVEPGPASDVYAFGVMLYQLLTGRRPTGRKGAADIVTGLSEGWDGIIDRCIEYRPQDRYQDGAELRSALKAFLAVDTGKQGTARARRFWMAAILLLGLFLVGAYWMWRDGAARPGPGDGRIQPPNRAVSGPRGSQQSEGSSQKETAGKGRQGLGGPVFESRRAGGTAEDQAGQTPAHGGGTTDVRQSTDAVQHDLIVIVNCEDTMLLDMAQGLLRTGLDQTGRSVDYVGDSQRASGSELRAKHAKLLAQYACPFIIAKVQAVDEYKDIAGATMPFSTVSVNLDLFDADSRLPQKRVTKQAPRGSLSLAKARKDALDLAMNAAIKEMLHELESSGKR